jgi:hypothetical protein
VTKECPNCKKENLDSAGFCQKCGTELKESSTNVNTTEESGSGIGGFWNKQSNGGKAAIGIGVCCLGIILIIAISGMMSPDKTTTTTTPTTTAPANTETQASTTTPTTTTTDKFSGLNNPDEVKSILSQYDASGDDKIAQFSEDADGQYEFTKWAVDAGMTTDDSATLVQLFNKYDLNGDGFWDIQEIDNFYDDYYNNQ